MLVMKSLFVPAIWLMDRFRFSVKFGLIFVVVMVPLVVLGTMGVKIENERIAFLEGERLGLAYIVAARQPIEFMQQHRGIMAMVLAGDRSAVDRAQDIRARVDEALIGLEAVDARTGARLETEGRVARIRSAWEAIKSAGESLAPAESLERHTSLLAELGSLIRHVSDSSNITLDPDLDSYYLGDALVNRLLHLTETMDKARMVGSGVAAEGGFSPDSFVQLAILAAEIDDANRMLRNGMAAAFRANPVLRSSLQAVVQDGDRAVDDFATLIKEMLESNTIDVSGPQVFDAATRAIGQVYGVYDAIVPELDALFVSRLQAGTLVRNVTLGIMALVLCMVAYLFAGLFFSIRNSVGEIREMTRSVAAGDLTARVNLRTRDELHDVADDFNAMSQQFESLIREIVGASTQLASAAEEVAAVSRDSADNVDRQRQETDLVATAMNEMTATVQEVSSNAAGAAEAARKTDSEAKGGLQVVEEASRSIAALAGEIENAAQVIRRVSDDSEAIGTVLDVIKGIAEQTNLLALNAAIEAARAGEQGRGFAVVADEVRTLASRTQDSTKVIEEMIGRLQSGAQQAVQVMKASQEQAQAGVDQADKAARALKAITDAVATINDMNTQIASAAEEQSATTEEMNRNVVSIRDLAEQTASGSEQTTAASQELARLAADLQERTRKFKIAS
jgi:methyl-accepting chemotaxis protein